MITEQDFKIKCSDALETFENRLLPAADEHGFEVESGQGKVTVTFDEPSHAIFVLSPQTPLRQIWVSALSTSFKFGWDEKTGGFVLDKTGEPFLTVMAGLVSRHLKTDIQL